LVSKSKAERNDEAKLLHSLFFCYKVKLRNSLLANTQKRKNSMIEKKTPEGVNFSDFICTFAMSFSILLFFSNTRISEFTDVAIF